MRICSILLIFLGLAACSGKAPSGMWSDPALNGDRLAEGIIIGGVVDLTRALDLFEQQQDAELLGAAFDRERPDLSIRSWADARSVLDPDSLDTILAEYRLSGRLSASHLRQLAVLSDRARYIALARIDLDQTTTVYFGDIAEADVDFEIIELSDTEKALSITTGDLGEDTRVYIVE